MATHIAAEICKPEKLVLALNEGDTMMPHTFVTQNIHLCSIVRLLTRFCVCRIMRVARLVGCLALCVALLRWLSCVVDCLELLMGSSSSSWGKAACACAGAREW